MDFDFSDEQKSLQDQVRRVLTEKSDSEVVRGVLDGDAAFDQALWQEVSALGWPAVAIPEEYGGLGMGHLELCLIAEELGRSLAPVPFSSSIYLFAEALLQAGSEEQKAAVLPEIATGEVIGTLAYAEGFGFAGHQLQVECRDGALYGEKWPVPDGNIADKAIVSASDEKGQTRLYLVDLKQETVEREELKNIDPVRPLAHLTFNGAACELLAESNEDQFHQVLNRAAILFAFEQIGGADACLEMAKEYALERKAFGRQIGGFQAVKHRLADIYVKNEIARANTYHGAWALSVSSEDTPLIAAVARSSAINAYEFAAKENIHLHGGFGFTWEANCHLYYRRERVLSVNLGNASVWKRKVTDELEKLLEAGEQMRVA